MSDQATPNWHVPTATEPAPADQGQQTQRDEPSLSLPKAGGSLRGMGEKFAANPVTGTASLTVPVALTKGREGSTPQLALAYDSGTGNGAFGLGWSMDVPSVSRKTDKGLPRYADSGPDADVFQLSGAEDLVPAVFPAPRAEETADVQYYRPRTEGLFARIERLRDRRTGDVFWRTTSKDNITSVFGRDPAARIADPADPSRVFKWLLEEVRDDRGNVTRYEYKADSANRYLKRVHYGLRRPDTPGDFCFELVLDYGEHHPQTPGPVETSVWPQRLDPFSNRRAGFEVRTARLCRRMLMFHRFPELGPDPVLVASTDLTYLEDPASTKLASITHHGYLTSGGTRHEAALPSLSFEYTPRAVSAKPGVLASVNAEPVRLGNGYQWADLDGEGVAGVLAEQDGTWYYRANLGNGTLGEPAVVDPLPAGADLTRRGGLVDLAGDGRKALAYLGGSAPGHHRRTEDRGWSDFTAFPSLPRLDWADRNLRLVDLTGDGLADVLITDSDGFTWHPSLGLDGFGDSSRLAAETTEERGPRLVFADAEQSVYLADMTGDGLTDLVRVRNGEVAYWPSLGYGRFGGRVTMTGAPVFDHPDRFDQRRVRLSDVDGSAPGDLLYLGPDGVRVWFNQAGNSWSAPESIGWGGVPGPPGEVSVTDLLGKGTACLVVADPRPDGEPQVRYLDLMADGKPHLMSTIDNGMGVRTSVRYASSTSYYLADAAAGEPWLTTLPFPVHVVSEVDVTDSVADTTLVSTYRYRHGHYDGVEREFRGFAYMEHRDSLSYTDSTGPFRQPPAVTKRWQHTGWHDDRVSEGLREEYWHQGAGPLLPDTVLPDGLDPAEARAAARALRGHVLREEIYTEDTAGNLSANPYSITETNYGLQLVQGRGNGQASVVLATAGQSISMHLEQQATDPRTSHTVALRVDEWGNVRQSAKIAYRRKDATDPEQRTTRITISEQDVVNDVGTTGSWRIGLPVEQREYEVAGVSQRDEVITQAELVAGLITAARDDVPFHRPLSGESPQRRLFSRTRQTYHSADLSTELPLGQAGVPTLPWRTYQQVFAPDQVSYLFGDRVDDALLTAAGYVRQDRLWWSPSGRKVPDATKFHLPTAYLDPFEARWQVGYDQHTLQPVRIEDPLHNVVEARLNYRVAQPWLTTDANGNRRGVRFDSLGMVVATAELGKGEGDHLDLSTAESSAEDSPTTYLEYELTAQPKRFHTFSREHHATAGTRWQETWTYLDGTGRTILVKTQAEPDDEGGERWVGTGRVVYDNKGNPIKQYEPYFAPDGGFDTDDRLVRAGIATLLRYDPLNRLVGTEFPDGSLARVEYGSWEQASWDRNDTVLESAWYAARHELPADDPHRIAAEATRSHAGTPERSRFDVLGRAHATIQDNGGVFLETTVVRDIQGNETLVIDPRGVEVLEQRFDMLGRAAYVVNADSGQRWSLNDVTGKPVRVWDGQGTMQRWSHDALRRPTHAYATTGGTERLRVRHYYGEAMADGAAHNLRARACAVFDGAGVVQTVDVDFKGNTLATERRLAADPLGEPDWSALATITDPDRARTLAGAMLERTGHRTESEYDALNRPVLTTTPDGSVTRPGYNEANLLERVDVRLRGAADWTPFVKNIDYDARAQRTLIELGCGARTRYDYEADSRRLSTMDTYAPDGTMLQALNFTYDPVGNLIVSDDPSQDTVFYANTAVGTARTYTYEPIYRLSTATGREHIGQTTQPGPGELDRQPLPHANDSSAMRPYSERYSYDDAGNITQVVHSAVGGSWTRRHSVADDGNRLRAISIPGDAPGTFSARYTHDANGNMTSMPHLPVLDWDAQDRLVHVSQGTGGGDTYYQYDFTGQRVRATTVSGGTTDTRIYLGAVEIYRRTVAGATRVERETLHVFDGRKRVALVETTTSGGGVPVPVSRFQLADHLGTASIELDDAARVLSYEEFHPFGTTSFHSAAGAAKVSLKRYRFTGKERDTETGFYYMGARYYAPWLGRWTSADPSGFTDGTNLYTYVRNRPVTMSDPNGRWGVEMHFGAVYLAGRLAGATHEESLDAAIMSQSMDDFHFRSAPVVKISAAFAYWGAPILFALTGRTPPEQMRYGNNAHALNQPNWEAASTVARRGIAMNNRLEFGLGLHTVGDFLPHASTSPIPSSGHQEGRNEDLSESAWDMHEADFTRLNPQKALATIVKFTELWSEFAKKDKHQFSKEELAAIGTFIHAEDNERGPALDAALKLAGVTPDQLREFNSYMWAPDAEKRRQNRFTDLKATAAGREAERDSMRIWMSVPNDSVYNSRAIDVSQYVGNNPEMPKDARFEARKAANLEKISPTYLRYIPVGPLQFPHSR